MKHLLSILVYCLLMCMLHSPATAQMVTEIETDKTDYELGEPIEVTFTLRNEGTEAVVIEGGHQLAKLTFDDFKSAKYMVTTPVLLFHNFAPEAFRTWKWVINPDETGLPYFSGAHKIKVQVFDPTRDTVYQDSVSVNAPTTLGGQFWVQYTVNAPPDSITSIKAELNVTVLDSTFNESTQTNYPDYYYEHWRVSGTPIIEAIEKLESSVSLDHFQYDAIGVVYDSIVNTERANDVQSLASEVYPNPFTDKTTLKVTLNKLQHVNIQLYDVLGREVKTLFDGLATGPKIIRLEGDDLAPGLYYYRVTTEKETLVKQVVRR